LLLFVEIFLCSSGSCRRNHINKSVGVLVYFTNTLFAGFGSYQHNDTQIVTFGYRTVFWSLAYVDWYQDNQPTDEQAFSKLLPRIHPGAVVLLHSTSQTNARILDTLLSKWEEMGYSFGTLDELFA